MTAGFLIGLLLGAELAIGAVMFAIGNRRERRTQAPVRTEPAS